MVSRGYLFCHGIEHHMLQKPLIPIALLLEVESSRTSLASRTHFEVLGLGLEASSPRKLACPRLEDSTIFILLKFGGALEKFFGRRVFLEIDWNTFCEDLLFFFGEHLHLCTWSLASSIPVLGLERVCPRKGCPWSWPRIFFVSLALASSLVSSTPPLAFTLKAVNHPANSGGLQ